MAEKRQVIVTSALIVKDGKIFIAKRAPTKKLFPNLFEIPGGHVEFGETPEEALKRELLEEMNLRIEVLAPAYVFTYLTDNGREHNVEIDYLTRLKPAGQKIILKPDEHSEYRWIDESEINIYLSNNKQMAEALKRGFKLLKKSQ
jgi:8-oxo-dGTP diphosphatase